MASVELIDECNALSERVNVPDDKIVVEAESLGGALVKIEDLLGVKFSPFQGDETFEGGQYFVLHPPIPEPKEPPFSIFGVWRKLFFGARPRPWETPCLPKNCVDIHIWRDQSVICPKQDLAFGMLEGDKLVIPLFVC